MLRREPRIGVGSIVTTPSRPDTDRHFERCSLTGLIAEKRQPKALGGQIRGTAQRIELRLRRPRFGVGRCEIALQGPLGECQVELGLIALQLSLFDLAARRTPSHTGMLSVACATYPEILPGRHFEPVACCDRSPESDSWYGQLNQFVVALDQFLERMLVGLANHRHQHTIRHFDGESDIDRRWVNNLVADQPARPGRCFRKERWPANAKHTGPGQAWDWRPYDVSAGLQVSQTNLMEDFSLGLTDPTFNPVCMTSSGDPVTDPTLTDPAACARAGYEANPNLLPGLVPYDLTRGGSLFYYHKSAPIKQQAGFVQDEITLSDWIASFFSHLSSLLSGLRRCRARVSKPINPIGR